MEENWSDKDYAAHYNRVYATPEEEFRSCLALLNLSGEDTLADFGCGNGDFLSLAAGLVKAAVGVDISGPQADAAERKLSGKKGVEIVRASFLDFKPGNRRFTKGFSRKALHHLTDPEKERFLLTIAPAFPSGALFLLEDGMFFGFGRSEIEKNWDALMSEAANYYGASWETKKKDIVHSFREEYPTGAGDWIRIFTEAGFDVIRREPKCSFYGSLLAVKK